MRPDDQARCTFGAAAAVPRAIAFAVHGPLSASDLPGLCDRVCGLLVQTGAVTASCDVGSVAVDAGTVEVLARLQMAARRHGCRIRLRHASPELRQLVAFMGLEDVLPG
jgi:ABC-type transporter Mla MlaB component